MAHVVSVAGGNIVSFTTLLVHLLQVLGFVSFSRTQKHRHMAPLRVSQRLNTATTTPTRVCKQMSQMIERTNAVVGMSQAAHTKPDTPTTITTPWRAVEPAPSSEAFAPVPVPVPVPAPAPPLPLVPAPAPAPAWPSHWPRHNPPGLALPHPTHIHMRYMGHVYSPPGVG